MTYTAQKTATTKKLTQICLIKNKNKSLKFFNQLTCEPCAADLVPDQSTVESAPVSFLEDKC